MWFIFFIVNSSKRHISITIHLIGKFKAHSRQITIHHFIITRYICCYLCCYVCHNNANVDNLISTLLNFGQWKGKQKKKNKKTAEKFIGCTGETEEKRVETISIYIYESSMWPDDIKFYVMALACLRNIST